MKKDLAIIGYGRFGRLAAHRLRKDFRVFVCDANNPVRTEDGVTIVPLQEAAHKKLIVLAVPINKLRSVLTSVAPLLSPGTLICDVSSVKEQPVRWMKSLLPRHTSLLGMHPLFGPDSASRTWKGKTIVVCPVRIGRRKLDHIARYLQEKGLVVRRMEPHRHDELMASSLFLTQFMGHALLRLALPGAENTTSNYRRLSEIARTTGRDSLELLHDMYAYNRHAWKIPRALVREFRRLHRELSRTSS